LDPVGPEHATDLFLVHSDPDVAYWSDAWSPEQAAAAAAEMARQWQADRVGKWIAHRRSDGTLVGAVGWVAGVGLAFPRENQYLWDLMTAGRWEEARALYRWYTPLLHLDTHIKFVHYIKLAIQECGLGAEWVRAPRLPLVGAEREQVLAVVRKGIETRPKVPARAAK